MIGVGRVVPVGKVVTKKGSEFEFVDGFEPDTVIATAAGPVSVARKAVSAAVIVAVSCVALTKLVGRGEPFQLTVSPFAKPVPFTVRVRPDGLQKGVLFLAVVDAESDVTVGKTMLNWNCPDTFALDAGLATVICAVPTEVMSAAGTTATSSTGFPAVALTYVVAS